jgi:hypothetical protein
MPQTKQPEWVTDIPIIETRGRPTSPEYAKLVRMPVGASFTSKKSRDTLYQIARNLGIKVTVLSARPGEGWRVWKRSDPIPDAIVAEQEKKKEAYVRRRRGRKLVKR